MTVFGIDRSVAPSKLAFPRSDIERTVPARFREVVRSIPNGIALTDRGRQWTYSDLADWTNRIACAIRAHTPADGGCVAFLVPQSAEMVAAALGVLKAGKAYLGIHPQMPTPAQVDIIQDASPQLIVTVAGLSPRAEEIAAGRCDILIMDELDRRYPDGEIDFPIRPEDPAAIFYTSGTTGKPKGVVKSHRAVLHRVWLSTQYDVILPEDRQSLLTHSSFSAAESDTFATLLQGARVCVFDLTSEGFSSFGKWINAEKITLLHPPVFLFREFLSTLEAADRFPSVRLVALAGDAVLPEDIRKWRRHFTGCSGLLHRFSTAETALLTVGHVEREDTREGTHEGEIVAAGKPVADKFIALLDEAGQEVDEGAAGEIVVRSRYLADGYWQHPQETAEAFRRDPADPAQTTYRTGDRGRFLPDGSLELLGRRQHLAKIRGYRVDTREVESALNQFHEIALAAVVVQKREDHDRLSAFVVMKEGMSFDARGIRERLRAHLPEWKIPSNITSLAALPATLSGKIDRQRLQSMASSAPAEAPSEVQSFSALEEALADIWRVSLRLDSVGLDDHFLDMGGDSISAMTTLNWLERLYGLRLSVAEFYQQATIRQLAETLRAAAGPAVEDSSKTSRESQHEQLSVSDVYLDLLNRHGVEFVFINPGTDTAPILESAAKAMAEGRKIPRFVLCLRESVAMAAAHGYFMISGRAQVAMVHVDVGTQSIGANLHNAQRGRAGVVVCAGRSPYTTDGKEPGGRNRYNHWIQEQFNQAGTVQGYVKWHYELTRAGNLASAVGRAFQLACAEPPGPVYLSLPREVLMEKVVTSAARDKGFPVPSSPAADTSAIACAARWLIAAEHPLILVGYTGRNPQAVAALVRLAEALAVPVVESRHRLNFPSSHPLHLGFSVVRPLPQADCVLIVDHDVPWVPAQSAPGPDAKIIQIDNDPLKRDMPLWGFELDLSIQADSSLALHALADEVELELQPADRIQIEKRRRQVSAEHDAQVSRLRKRALDLASVRPIAPEWAATCLNEVVDDDTIVVSEAVTNGPVLWDYLRMDRPGTFFQSLGSGLGWGLGAAIGAKLASPSKTVICVVGDGSWIFGDPLAAYWTAQQQDCPFLTVIFNNRQYHATVEAILSLAPKGAAWQSGNYPACETPKGKLYAKVSEAMGLWARTVEDPAELPAALREALQAVRGGRPAVLDICISAGMTEPNP